ncbi:MAG: nucleoside monophosphate kinase [Anaerolineae bacterium]|nr:nucleoside monophosphate kinase [Anaerolineae bacterium]
MSLYIIIMGVQGAGKGVQAKFISSEYSIPHISTGDLFRAMKTREDELARRIQQIMASGQLVSDDVTNEVLRDRLEQPDAANGVILDGYPRNPAQADWLADYLKSRGEAVTAVLLLNLDLFTAFKRAFGRVSSAETGKIYNIFFDDDGIDWHYEEDSEGKFPPRVVATETETGKSLVRRPDDANAGAIIKRIDTYLETTMPLVDYYRRTGLLREIDAAQSIEDVSQSIRTVIEQSS